MSRIDEHTQVRQRLGALGGPEPPGPEFIPGPPHSGRWDEETLDEFEEPPAPDEVSERESPTPTWEPEPPGGIWHDRLVPERLRGTRWDPGHRGAMVLAGVGVTAVLVAGAVSLRDKPVAQAVPSIAAVRTEAVSTPQPGQVGTPAGQGGAGSGRSTPSGNAAPSATAPTAAGAPTGGGGVASSGGGVANGGNASGGGAANGDAAGGGGATGGGVANGGGVAGGGGVGGTPTGINGHSASGEVVVSVIGVVDHGGLLRFPSGARVADALTAASPRAEADLSGLNLAQHLSDGDQIVIGRGGARPGNSQVGSVIVGATPQSPSAAATPTASPSGSPRPSGTAKKIDLNTATEADLDALPGVGPITAKAILGWRTQHGRFTSIDQLADIDGIGPSRLAKLRVLVTI